MRTVYKYEFPEGQSVADFSLDPYGKILKVYDQNNKVCMWVEVNIEASVIDRAFVIYGTGWKIGDYREYVGTVNMANGSVWHVYEVVKP